MNIQRITTQEGPWTHGTAVGEEAGEVDGLHVVARQAASCAREVVAELAVERLAAVLRISVLAPILPQVFVG